MELNISFDSCLSSYIMQTLKLTVMKFKISHIIWSVNIFTQLCPTLCSLMNCSPSSSSLQGILQARILEWVVISFSRASSPPRDQTSTSCLAVWFLITETLGKPSLNIQHIHVNYSPTFIQCYLKTCSSPNLTKSFTSLCLSTSY